MMPPAAAEWIEEPTTPPTDQRVIVHGVSWASYCLMRELLDSPGIRLSYLEGALEIMSPSRRHEYLKKVIARLVEVFAEERDIPLEGYGSTTFRREARERGLEPDECYVIDAELRDAPDIAIEVVLTSGGLDKLSIYAGLGVREVWFWRKERFEIPSLEGAAYQAVPGSRLIPTLDFEQLATVVRGHQRQHAAVKAYRALLRTPPHA